MDKQQGQSKTALQEIIGGGMTFLSFKPCCDKLKASLQDTMLSNPDYNPLGEEDNMITADSGCAAAEMQHT